MHRLLVAGSKISRGLAEPGYAVGGCLDDDSESQIFGPEGRDEHSRVAKPTGPPPKILWAGPEGRDDPGPHPLLTSIRNTLF